MLCTSCRRTLLLRLPSTLHPSPPSLSRSVATVPATPSAPPSQPPPSAINLDTPPPTLSSSPPGSSQPLSKPTVTLPLNSTAKPQPGKEPTKPTKLVGSIPGGAPLFGVAYLKAKPTVLAMEDDAYPDWLWGLVDEGKKSASSGGGGGDAVDLSSMTKKQRQKYDRKQERLLKTLPKRIPVHEQSKDLTGPGDDAVVSLERRQEITKSSRMARRKDIRENNFLRSM